MRTRTTCRAASLTTALTLLGLSTVAACSSDARSPEVAGNTSQALGGAIHKGCPGGNPAIPTASSLVATDEGTFYDLCLPMQGDGDFMFLYGRVGDPITQQVIQSKRDGSSNLFETAIPTGAMYFFQAQSHVNGNWAGWSGPSYVYYPHPDTRWADVDQPGDPYLNAFAAGNNGATPYFACAAVVDNGTHIGSASVADPRSCHIGLGGVDRIGASPLILQGGNRPLYWVGWDGSTPGGNAIGAGWADGNEQFICQAHIPNIATSVDDVIPGKTVGNACVFAYQGKEWRRTPGVGSVVNILVGGNGPIALSNASNYVAPKTAEAAYDSFGDRAAMALQFGACTMRSIAGELADQMEGWSTNAIGMMGYQGTCPAGSGRIFDPNHPELDTVCPWPGASTPAYRACIVDAKLATMNWGDTNLGTTTFKTIPGIAKGHEGELDTAVKDIVPILFLYANRLKPQTVTSTINKLGALLSGPRNASLETLYISSNDVSVWAKVKYEGLIGAVIPLGFLIDLGISTVEGVQLPESENHLLLIESSRYLMNQLLLKTNATNPAYDNIKNGNHDWWMQRLQAIMMHDFSEYNAKPYQRFSLDAVQNLAELASEADLRAAARMVLDFSSAKFAVSSSLLRRSAPFRRRGEYDKPFFNDNEGIDEQTCRFFLYSGQVDTLGKDAAGNPLAPGNCNGIVRQAIGSYRVPPMILDLAMHKSAPYFQTFNGGPNFYHGAPGGLEIYDNEGPFLIAAGGVERRSGVSFTVKDLLGDHTEESTDDSTIGISVPTVLFPNDPSNPRDNRDALLQIHGMGHQSSNLCVGHGFACGLAPQIGADLQNAPSYQAPGTGFSFYQYKPEDPQHGFYVAKWETKPLLAVVCNPDDNGCENTDPPSFGFFEAVPATAFANLADFKTKVLALNPNIDALTSAWFGLDSWADLVSVHGVYQRALGGTITFDHGSMLDTYPIVDTSHPLATAMSAWNLADGPIQAEGHDGKLRITGDPSYGVCSLDFSNVSMPARSGCDQRKVVMPVPPSCTVTVATCGSVTFTCPPTPDYLTFEYQLPDGTWGPSTTFNASYIDTFKSLEPYTVRFCASNSAGTACDAPRTFTPDLTGLLTSCKGVNNSKLCGKTPDHCGGILDCGACPVITTCDGDARPTTKCSASWHCCGTDGWNCGVCP